MLEHLRHFSTLDKQKLLEEMISYQKQREREGYLSKELILKGIPLFEEINHKSDTAELKTMSKVYLRHLHIELSSIYTNPRSQTP